MERVGLLLLLCLGVSQVVGKSEEKTPSVILAQALGYEQKKDDKSETFSTGDEYYYYPDEYTTEKDGVPGKQSEAENQIDAEPFLQDLIKTQGERNNKVGAELDAMKEPSDQSGPSGASGLGAWAGLGSYGFRDLRNVASPNFQQFYGPLSVSDSNPAAANLEQIDHCPRSAESGIKYYCLQKENGQYYDPWNPFCGYIECSSGVATRMACSQGTWMGVMEPVTTSQKDLCRKNLVNKITKGACPKTTDYPLCAKAEETQGITSQ